MHNLKLNKILTLTLILTVHSEIFTQTIGTWNSSSSSTTTFSAVGIGTNNPRSWAEIEYCQNTQIGLIISKAKNCSPLGGSTVSLNTGSIWDNTQGGFVVGNVLDEEYSKAIPISFEYLPVLSNPSRPYTGMNGISFPMYSGGNPLIWAREEESGSYGTRFLVTADGRVGINMPSPRAPLDVRGSYELNVPIAIFGINSGQFTRHLHLVANLGDAAYNGISQSGDFGLFYTDGLDPNQDGSNADGSLVIAPWNQSGAGGMRMDSKGNMELRGNLLSTRVKVSPKWWPDFAFASEYDLMPLDSLENYIQNNRHLPGVPSEDSIFSSGQDIGEIQRIQQLKIEELTLYIIQQQKMLEKLSTILREQVSVTKTEE